MYLILSVLRQNFLVIITQCSELSSLPGRGNILHLQDNLHVGVIKLKMQDCSIMQRDKILPSRRIL